MPVFNGGFLPALSQNDVSSILQNDEVVLPGSSSYSLVEASTVASPASVTCSAACK